ncbi:MAG TPA: peptide ABC transporter substrate-binding protein, partial [Dehalococcoidia bacterium]|nr:peptide ABC transporter substrate-binding protein [Dehalococcoidia bacterium]
GILPAHLLGGISVAQLMDSPFNQHPVGAGPYRLEQLSDSAAVLVAHSAYHFNQPYIPRFEMRFFRDQGALMAALKAGNLDGAFLQSPLGPTETFELERRRDLRIQALDTGHVTSVYLNLQRSPFDDRRLRQALLYAVDRDGIVSLLGGQAVRADSPVPPGSWAFSPSLTRYGADVDLAAILLDEAGWTKGADGLRRRGSTPLAFTLVTDSDPVRVEIAQRIAKGWEDLGARVTVQPAGLTTIVREMIEPRRYEAVLFSVDAANPDPDPYWFWHSSQATARGSNLASFSSQAADALLEQARGNSNHAQRRELYEKFQELFAQEVPGIPLYASTALYVQKTRIADVKAGMLTQPGDRFWQAHEWYIKDR